MALFIAYLFNKGYASSTVTTYVSALAYIHKLNGLSDPSKSFLIVQLIRGYRKKVRKVDVRLPITRAILHKLIHSSSQFSDSDFSKVRFNAMCTLAFHAFLRVGEMTLASPGAPPPIQLRQLTRLTNSNGYCVALKLTFTDFKHNYNK